MCRSLSKTCFYMTVAGQKASKVNTPALCTCTLSSCLQKYSPTRSCRGWWTVAALRFSFHHGTRGTLPELYCYLSNRASHCSSNSPHPQVWKRSESPFHSPHLRQVPHLLSWPESGQSHMTPLAFVPSGNLTWVIYRKEASQAIVWGLIRAVDWTVVLLLCCYCWSPAHRCGTTGTAEAYCPQKVGSGPSAYVPVWFKGGDFSICCSQIVWPWLRISVNISGFLRRQGVMVLNLDTVGIT